MRTRSSAKLWLVDTPRRLEREILLDSLSTHVKHPFSAFRSSSSHRIHKMSHRQPFKPSPAPEPSKDTSSITSQNDTGTTKKLSIAQNSTEIAPVLNLSGLKRSKYKNAERIPAAHALEQNRTLDSSSLQSTPSQPSSNHFSTSFAMPAPLNHSIRGSPAFMLPSAFDSSARAESARTPSHTNSSNSHSSFRPTSSATHTTHPLLRPASAAPFSSTAQSNIRAFSRSVQRPASVAPVSAPLPNELTPADIGTHSHQHDLSTEYWPSEQQGQMTVGDRDYNEYDDNTENEENVPPFQSGGFEVHSTYNSPAPDGHNHQTWGNAHVVSEKRRRSEECSSEREGGHVDSGSDSRKRMRLSAPLNQQVSVLTDSLSCPSFDSGHCTYVHCDSPVTFELIDFNLIQTIKKYLMTIIPNKQR